jgi:hypothetical protein
MGRQNGSWKANPLIMNNKILIEAPGKGSKVPFSAADSAFGRATEYP